MNKTKKDSDRKRFEIAVIGMAGRFPGAGNIDAFWDNLKNSVESITFFSDEELEKAGIEPELLRDPNYVKAFGMLDHLEYFDASFFEYTPGEIELMNPQTRIFHECVWEALEDAGYDPESYDGLIGLYAGASSSFHWEALSLLSGKSADMGYFAAGSLSNRDHMCTKISYKLNLKGPSTIVQTACSTSLAAIHWASRAVLSGECHIALAGGVTVTEFQRRGYLYGEGMILSPDGHCRAFDTEAGGTVGGNGASVVVLKRLTNAISDGDNIYAVIKGSAVNNDGNRKVGFAAPSVKGQTEVIRTALAMARVEPESIGYVETHGTGTTLGDPIEIEALKQAFNIDKKGVCAIGSVKTNVGHLDAAAGVTGFIKAVLALKHKVIPPSLNFHIPNPGIDFIDSPFYVNVKPNPWETDTYPRRAGVSSFGIGGTNAHVILEEWTEDGRKRTEDRKHQLILLSAKTQSALDKMKENLTHYFRTHPDVNLADTAHTLQVGRKTFKHRWFSVCSTVDEAITALTSLGKGETHVYLPEEESAVPGKLEPADDKDSLMRTGCLWLQGKKIDWKTLYPEEEEHGRRRISLPTYPFEKHWYWIEGDPFKMGTKLLEKNPLHYKNEDMADWFYIPSWKRVGKPTENPGDSPVSSYWLVFIDEHGHGDLLVNKLKEKEHNVIIVKMGMKFQKEEDRTFTLNPRNSDGNGYDALFDELERKGIMPDRIVHLWGITPIPPVGDRDRELEIETVKNIQDRGYYSLLNIARAVGRKNVKKRIDITVITNNMHEVIGGDALSPGKATILGPVRVIPVEFNGICCRSIDIELHEAGTPREAKLINQLMEELSNTSAGSFNAVVAYRGDYRWVLSFEPIRLEKAGTIIERLRPEGVYLITGGLGGIGLALAEYLAKKVRAKLILTGRSRFPSREIWQEKLSAGIKSQDDEITRKIRKIREFEEAGAEVAIFSADVSDPQQMQAVIDRIIERFGQVNGVIHSAGLPDGDMIQGRSRQTSERIFSSKINGTLLLAEVVKHVKPDFMIFCSSLSALLPVFGQVAYCAANAFMDALAIHLSHRGGPFTVSINWDRWKNVGMAVTGENMHKELTGEELAGGITKEEGVEAFQRILDAAYPQVAVTPHQLELMRERFNTVEASAVSQALEENAPLKPEKNRALHPRPLLKTPYKAPMDQLEQILADIWQEYFGFDAIGVFDDFFQLGGDSLIGMRFVNRYNRLLKEIVHVNVIFDAPTIAKLAAYFKEHYPNAVARLVDTDKEEQVDHRDERLGLETIERVRQLIKFPPPRERDGNRKNRQAIFVLCSTRSGSTLLRVILAGHPKLFAPPELLLLLFDSLGEMKGNEQGVLRAIMQIKECSVEDARAIFQGFKEQGITTLECYRLLQDWIGDRILVDKTPNYALDVEVLKRAEIEFEDPLYIHLVRHPYGMIHSFIEAKMDLLDGRKALKKLSLSRRHYAELNWVICHQNILKFLESIPGDRKFRVRFEDLVTQPRVTVEGICRFLRLDFCEDMMQPYKDKKQRMTDGIHSEGIMIGDFKFHKHTSIDANVADTWRKKYNVDFLSDVTWKIAQFFDYKPIHENMYLWINPTEKRDYYPLSSSQKRLYLLHCKEKENTAYNMAKAFVSEEVLDKEKVERACRKLIDRHESLRTSFKIIDGEPAQIVHDQVEFSIEYFVVTLEENPRKLSLKQLIDNFVRFFNLSCAPLFRVGIIRTGDGKNILVTDMHHIISDGVSHSIMIRDFATFYYGKERPALKIQYKDFSLWQKTLITSGEMKRQETYWLSEFSGHIPEVVIPSDYDRPFRQSFEGAEKGFKISRDETSRLKELARNTGSTIFMVLLAVYNVLLSKLSGQGDIIVGTGIAGRRRAEFENVIGMFVNTLALRNYPTNEKSFKEFLREVKEKTLQAFSNQDYMFDDLVEKLRIKRDMSRNPLFDTALVMQDTKHSSVESLLLEKMPVEFKLYEYETGISQFDIALFCGEAVGRLSFRLTYRTKLFKEETMDMFINHFKEIISLVIENQDIQLKDITLSTDLEIIKSAVIQNDPGDFGF